MNQTSLFLHKPLPRPVLEHFAGMHSQLAKVRKKQPHEITLEEVIKQVQSFQKGAKK